MQLCGAVNIAVKTENALQFSGLTNVCQGKLRGVQFAPGNYAGEVSGAQIGLLNLCGGNVKGIQIGIINHSKDTTAHKLGLVNITPKTRIQMILFAGNTSKLNAAVLILSLGDVRLVCSLHIAINSYAPPFHRSRWSRSQIIVSEKWCKGTTIIPLMQWGLQLFSL